MINTLVLLLFPSRFLRGQSFAYSYLLLWQKWIIFITKNQQHNTHPTPASRNSYLKSIVSQINHLLKGSFNQLCVYLQLRTQQTSQER